MKTLTIKAEKRTDLGKKANKALRKAERVPGVIYGGEEVVHIHMFNNDMRHLLYTPEVFFVDIEVEGKTYRVIKQETQFHPVTDNLLHIDFLQIFDDKAVAMDIPLKVEGQSVGVKKGGVLKKSMRYVAIKALPTVMPDKVVVDVTDLDINDTLKISDIKLENVEFLLNPATPVVAVATARGAAAAGDEEGEEGEEGEDAEASEE